MIMGCCVAHCVVETLELGVQLGIWPLTHPSSIVRLFPYAGTADQEASPIISISSQSSSNKDHAMADQGAMFFPLGEGFAFWLWPAFPATTISTTKSHLLR